MNYIGTEYKATLAMKDGQEIRNVKILFDGTYLLYKEMWIEYNRINNTGIVKWFDKNDNEPLELGLCKVKKMDRIDKYQEITPEIIWN